jgi:F0F1-type ATP synthase assembly protein I
MEGEVPAVSERQEGKEELDKLTDLERAWIGEHRSELRRSASGLRLLRASLIVGFVIGLTAHVGGYLLRSAVETEPFELLADLLYGLGFALWTGVVVVAFAQVWPEWKKRQINALLDAYEEEFGGERRAGDAL